MIVGQVRKDGFYRRVFLVGSANDIFDYEWYKAFGHHVVQYTVRNR